MKNVLDQETSPYLLQHKDNPVHWQPWGAEALEAAKRDGKPLLLSVGYAACHWCHVMAHESFEDQATADVMNDLFVNIKVDREERPDIDQIYQSALALLGQQGGWPLTMFLTPDGEPFWGGTYFPPEHRYGRPGFTDVLKRVREVYDTDQEAVTKNSSAIMAAMTETQPADGDGVPVITNGVLDQIAERLLREVDMVNGGVGDAPKFPQNYLLELLWRSYLRTGSTAMRDAVLLSLTKMSQGGIYDHLGGGFARYSTDERWLVPHFEKMLYDNAQLIDLLVLAWQETKSPLFEQKIQETAEWVLREMIAEGGGFAATLDADSEGVEGKFYVWGETEVDALLGPDAALFKEIYDVTSAGNWEGNSILNRIDHPELGPPEQEAELARMRIILRERRDKRIWPGWDDKVLADWNGLMISALANAAMVFSEPAWMEAAQAAFRFACEKMTVDGRLRHSARNGQIKHAALLDDYANLARAALTLHETTGDGAYLDQAERWCAVLDKHYWDGKRGGYYYTADDAEALITRTRNAMDNAVPSGNGVMLGVLARLWYLTGKAEHRKRADDLVAAFAGELRRNFFPLTTYLNAFDLFDNAVQVVIIGDRAEPDTQALLRATYTVSAPNRVLAVIGADADLPDSHPAKGKTQVDGKATAYVCVGTTCSLPQTEPTALQDA
ncbi:MAG: thioredoxin domain-containing protein, partial [Minwuiales bacterium]|nr:thioredoxin domain-containing protein [Minwuiales bacterium]